MKSPHVLVIEPDKILASQIEEYLLSKNYRVTVAHDAQAAVLAADTTTPNVVVLEVLLAQHSGIEFLYEFRSYSEWQRVPVIILSRVSQADLQVSPKTMQDLGIVAALYKPQSRLQKIGDAIDKALLTSVSGNA